MMTMPNRFVIVLIALALAACSPVATSQPPATRPPSPAPTVAVVAPTASPDCGAEAAIALAQTQSDLALAAVAEVDAAQQTSQDPTAIGQAGQGAYSKALSLMKEYDVPPCLLQGKVFAAQFFDERVAAYAALAAGDSNGYQAHLANGEAARQNMVAVVNGVLGQ
jgi:hypothetical protein